MNNKQLIKNCLIDRTNSFNNKKKPFYKEYFVDLFVKELILFSNSIGKKNYNSKNTSYFVDEVRNSNMSNNIYNAYNLATMNKIESLYLKFYTLNTVNHIKIGYLEPLLLIVYLIFTFPLVLFFGLFKKEYIFSFLISVFVKFIKNIDFFDNRIYLMTDHHFFSSIIAMLYSNNSYVLQHGLILDKRFFLPIRAGHFCAWGEHSIELMMNDPKAIITGTVKYSGLKPKHKGTIHKIMYCISSLNDEVVARKINIINNVTKKLGYEFLVKCHPGSMFDVGYWKSRFKGENITFYKEEKLIDLNFDLAISENSTINVDFAVLDKPFIIYDSIDGYFSEYKGLIPFCNSEEELLTIINNIDSYNFTNINSLIIKRELNNNTCCLFKS